MGYMENFIAGISVAIGFLTTTSIFFYLLFKVIENKVGWTADQLLDAFVLKQERNIMSSGREDPTVTFIIAELKEGRIPKQVDEYHIITRKTVLFTSTSESFLSKFNAHPEVA
jgi:hypothetical protein